MKKQTEKIKKPIKHVQLELDLFPVLSATMEEKTPEQIQEKVVLAVQKEAARVSESNVVALEEPSEVPEEPVEEAAQGTDEENSEETEEEVYVKAFYNDEEREEVALENTKLVYYVANMFRTTGIDIEELISVGMLGYAKAINTFDKNRAVKFSTYAINVIRNEILFFMRKENKHRAKSVSMNTTLSTDQNGNPFELEDIMEDDRASEVGEEIFDDERRAILMEAVSRLAPKEQFIVLYRYGLVDGKKRTQKVISQQIHMSQANVSKLQKTSLEKLKRHLKEISGNRGLTFEESLEL